jgi:hypothetical protein
MSNNEGNFKLFPATEHTRRVIEALGQLLSKVLDDQCTDKHS